MYTPSYDYLEHHGILGQKWGIRRYQNSDGTLTTEGKERYNPNRIKKDLKKVEKAGYFNKSKTFARTKTARQIYKDNKKELQTLKKQASDVAAKWEELYEKEMKKHYGEKHEDYEWEEISRNAEKAVDKLLGANVKSANMAYINKCKEAAKNVMGDLYDTPIGKLNGKDITVDHFISSALDQTMDDMFMRDLVKGETMYDNY